MTEMAANRIGQTGKTRRSTFFLTVLLVIGTAVIGMTAAGAQNMLSGDAGLESTGEMTVRASGDTGEERLDIQVDGQTVATIDLTTEMADHTVAVAAGTLLSDVRVAFLNDALGDDFDRNVTVDHVVFADQIFESEAESTRAEGVYADGRCQAGSLQTERLQCNGYFQYDAGDVNMDSELLVRAAGDTGDERFDVHVGGDVVASVEVTDLVSDYPVAIPADTAISDIKIVFSNDAVQSDYDRNLFIDYVVHNGTTYESEAETTYAEGHFLDGACSTGNPMTEWLHCNGFLSYSGPDAPPTATTAPSTVTTSESTTTAPATSTSAAPSTTAPSTTTTAPSTTATTEATTTTTAPPSGSSAEVVNYNTNWCMGVGEGSSPSLAECGTDGAAMVSFAEVGSNGIGQVRIDGRCLVPENTSRKVDVPVALRDCGTGDEFLWFATDWRWGQDQVMLRNRHSGMCIAADELSDGAGLSQKLCNPTDDRSQMWGADFVEGMRAKDFNNIPPVNATYHGVINFSSFDEGAYPMDSWTYGDISFYAPPGRATQEMANRWVAWYAHMDALHREVWGQDNFETVYRATDPNHGRKKVVAMVDRGNCSCGNKQHAEILGFTNWIMDDPENWMYHWVMFYEMNRGGSRPDFYTRATWPNTDQGGLILPHMMAALAAYEIGGPAGLERDVPGDFLKSLTEWRESETIPLAEKDTPADIQMSILVTILQEQGSDTFVETLRTMATKPGATGPVQALCDFRDAVNATTGGQYNNRMSNDWRLPTNC